MSASLSASFSEILRAGSDTASPSPELAALMGTESSDIPYLINYGSGPPQPATPTDERLPAFRGGDAPPSPASELPGPEPPPAPVVAQRWLPSSRLAPPSPTDELQGGSALRV